jgi:vacuolar-type H+-ATPase subunit H
LNRENPVQNITKNPIQNPIENIVKNKTKEQLEAFFMDRIINGDKDIRKNVTEMNKYNIKDQLFDNNILNKIKKDEPSLYRLIERWSENEEKRNNKLLDDIIRQVSGYKSNIDVVVNQLTRQNIINNAEEINKKNYEKNLYEFYKAITEKLKQSEEKKMESYSKILYKGGKNDCVKNDCAKNDCGKQNDFITRKYKKLSKKYTAKILRRCK